MGARYFKGHHATASALHRVAEPDEIANDPQFIFAGDRVAFRKLMPRDVKALGFELVDLLAHDAKGNQRIIRSVRDEKALLPGHWRNLLEQPLRLVHAAADANQTCKALRVAQSNVDRH